MADKEKLCTKGAGEIWGKEQMKMPKTQRFKTTLFVGMCE